MIVLGLTGSIGMGKSTVAKMFKTLKIPVCDADAISHNLMLPGGAGFNQIAKLFPNIIYNGKIDRVALSNKAFYNINILRILEQILHPLIRHQEKKFLAHHKNLKKKISVLENPLLYEIRSALFCDFILVVSSSYSIQFKRVMARPGMTREKFNAILQKQIPDCKKRFWADFIIPTGTNYAVTFDYIQAVVENIIN